MPVKGELTFRYRAGFTQPCRNFELRMPAPSGVNWQGLDRWLQSTFGVTMPSEPTPVSGKGERGEIAVHRLAWRGLLLATTLLRAGRVPVFDPGKVLEVSADEYGAGQWQVSLMIAHIDHLTNTAYPRALQVAGHLLTRWVAGTPPRDREALFRELDAKLVQPLQALARGGQSGIHILEAAYAAGIPFFHLGGGTYQMGWGARSLLLRHSSVMSDSGIGVRSARDKFLTALWLRMSGLPAPVHWRVDSEQHALEAGRQLGWPVVVKPADRGRGEGVVVGVDSDDKLVRSYRDARQLSAQILVEKQAAGRCHRIVICKGRMLYAVERLPQSVVGDGTRTVKELISAGNEEELRKPSWERRKPHPADALALDELQAAGLSFDSVPAPGQRVFLRPIESTQWGGDVTDCTATIHPGNVEVAERAAALFGLTVAGVDLITTDITRPWYDVGAIINEINAAPMLGAYPLSRDRLGELLDRLLPGTGRIPVEVMLGGSAAMIAARNRQQAYVARQTECFVTGHGETFSPTGGRVEMAISGLVARCHALLMDRRVSAIILVIQTDEILDTGLPVDRIERLEVLPGMLGAVADAGGGLDEESRIDRVVSMIKYFLAGATPASQPEA